MTWLIKKNVIIKEKRGGRVAVVQRLKIGQKVMVLNFGKGQKWIEGIVTQIKGPVTYLIRLVSGHIIKRHYDQILMIPDKDNDQILTLPDNVGSCNENESVLSDTDLNGENAVIEDNGGSESENTERRVSTRNRHPPDRLGVVPYF